MEEKKTAQRGQKAKPEKMERMDCFICGGKNTMEFVRSSYNGHKRGKCLACGTHFIE